MKYYELTLKFLVTDKMLETTAIADEISILANAHDLCVVGVGAQADSLEEITLREARRRFTVPDDYPSSGPEAVAGRCEICHELIPVQAEEWLDHDIFHKSCLAGSEAVKGRCVECGELVHWHDAEWVGDKLWHGECLIRSDQEEGISHDD